MFIQCKKYSSKFIKKTLIALNMATVLPVTFIRKKCCHHSPLPPLTNMATILPMMNDRVQELLFLELYFPVQGIGRIRTEAVAIFLLPQLRPLSFVVDYVAVATSPTSPTPPSHSP
jgi:hypothetical protein